ncbi:Kruppel homolog 1 [Carabus blaptoides fortunei]
MSAVLDYLNVCRLCLVKDKVNIAIFDETSDVRQLFLKISACLPVKVAQDDRLPKKICDTCLYKVDLLYQFWNTTISSEKQLLQWCGGYTGGETATITGAGDTLMLPQSHAHPHSIHTDTIIVKEERLDSADTKSGDGYGPELSTATATVSASDLYSEEFALTYHQQQPEQLTTVNYTSSAPNQTPTKRPRGRPPGSTKKKRQATRSRARRDSVEDSDDDRPLAATISVQEDHLNSAADLQITKKEAESDEDYVDNTESLEPTTFVAVPSTSACELPGPSGTVTKDSSTSIEQGPTNLTRTSTQAAAEDAYTCSVCAKQCNDKETLRLHNRSHKERKQACSVCGKKFHYQFEVRKHARRHGDTDGTADTSVECDLCNKRLVNAFSLSVHKRRHTLDYTDRCTECNKGFYTKAECQQHYNVEHRGHCSELLANYCWMNSSKYEPLDNIISEQLAVIMSYKRSW